MNKQTQVESKISSPPRAIVHCLESTWDASLSTPCSLVPFLNRPFLHHVVEQLIEDGHESIEILCNRFDREIEQSLGSGERWGASFSYVKELNRDKTERERIAGCQISVASHSLPGSTQSDPELEMIRVDSPSHFLASQQAAMRQSIHRFLTLEEEVDAGQFQARGVKVHPSATIRGPVLIGENARIGPGVHIGPYSVIGSHCVLRRNSSICRSSVMPGVYVGEGLELADSILFSDRLINVRLGATVSISDSLLVGSV